MKLIIKILIIGMLTQAALFGFEWQTFTNANEITAMASGGGRYMAATTGGVMLYNPDTDEITKFVNTSGLGGVNITASTYADSCFWFGSTSGELSRFDPEFNEFKQFMLIDRDGTPLRINHLYAQDEFLWISTNIGVSLFDIERHGGEIKETYRRFGDIPAGTEAEAVTILRDTVWIATSRGVARIALDDPNLLDFTHWVSFDFDNVPELPSDMFIDILNHNQTVWGLAENYAFEIISSGNSITIGEIITVPRDIYSCLFTDDTLFLGCVGGLLLSWSNQVLDTVEIADLNTNITALDLGLDNTLIAGSSGQGIFVQKSTRWSNLTTSGPLFNEVLDLTESSDNQLWFVHNNTYVSTLQNSDWDNILVSGRRLLSAEADTDGSVWLGTFGGKVYNAFSEDNIQPYDTSNSTLIGNNDPNGLKFIVVFDMDLDNDGIMWYACYRGHVRQPIAFFDKANDLWSFISYSGFKSNAKIQAIHSTGEQVWAGFEDDGIYLIEFNGDPFDLDISEITQFTRRESLLPSDNVSCIEEDNNGVIWVGTDMGLSYFDPGVDLFIRTVLPEGIGPQITSIEFDLRNNMWIGTQSGLAFRASGEIDFSYFTSENSELVSDKINALLFASDLNLWIATDQGVSTLEYNIGNVTEDIAEVYAYPNPFIMSTAEDKVFFNFIAEVEVQIYSLDGVKIKTIASNDGWDGTNANGEKVASGMYIFYMRDSEGTNHTGKIAVVRK